MKITVIIGKNGKVVGAFHGHAKDFAAASGGLSAVPVAGPGQEFHEIDVPEELLPRDAPSEVLNKFPQRVKKYLRKGTASATRGTGRPAPRRRRGI